jgi:hypothetical protein
MQEVTICFLLQGDPPQDIDQVDITTDYED